jgi:5-methylcytosine-specific restriction endonuclease McrA
MRRRREFSAKVKLLAWERARGCCEQCGIPIAPKKPEFDHDNPCGLTGEPDLSNCRALCRACHRAKTTQDVAQIARAKRRQRKHVGIRKPSKLPCSRDSKFKRKIGGEVVLR